VFPVLSWQAHKQFSTLGVFSFHRLSSLEPRDYRVVFFVAQKSSPAIKAEEPERDFSFIRP
jgi:hypothetical protein